MTKRLIYLLLTIIMVVGASCERRPLYDEDANVYISFVFDEEMPNVDVVQLPELMKVNFFQTSNSSLPYSFYINPEGGYVNVDYDNYNISTYNFDTEFTQIRNDDDIDLAEAYTSNVQPDPMANYSRLFQLIKEQRAQIDISSRLVEDYTNQTLVNQPDHLYTGLSTNKTVKSQGDGDICNVVIPVSSIVKTYRLEIGTITGIEYLNSAIAYITGQAMSEYIYSQEVTGDPCSIYIELAGKSRSTELSSLFNTFNRHPSTSAYVVLQLVDLDGNMQIYEWDVTNQFNDETNKERVIRVDQAINIQPPTNQNMQPVVNLWEENNYIITL